MIVKIQTPLMTNDPDPQALVYNQSRDFEATIPVTKELKKLMKGEPKKFFEIRVSGESIGIVREVTWRNW